VHQEPPEVAWPEPELEPGLDDGLPRLLELPELVELEPDEPELDDPVLEEPELELEDPDVPEVPELDEPELVLPELVLPELALPELAWPELLLDEFVPVAALLDEPGRASATAPAASTLATPTVAVVATTRPLARWRAATPRATASRFGLFMS
jgi:hypothetical protein